MSSQSIPRPPGEYTGPEQYADWIEDYLDLRLSDAQRDIITAVARHERVLVVGANGFGKSFAVAALTLAWLFTHYPSIALATSGTYGKLRRTLCRPIENLHRQAKSQFGLPGTYKHSPPRVETEFDPEWYFEAARPKDAGELEGTHSEHLLAIIEEADKRDVDEDVLDSMESLLTDDRDRIIAIANPPRDESNIVHEMMQPDSPWHVLQYSSFESHNVLVELDEAESPMLDGLTTLGKIQQDWVAWNNEPWPGVQDARTAHEKRDNLDTRWYRRRAGITPPGDASVHRPLEVDLVDAAYDPEATPPRETPTALGIDVARSGDDTVAIGTHDSHLQVEYEQQGTDHTEQEQALAEQIRSWPTPPIAVDAVGEGSGLADGLENRFGTVHRFKNQSQAVRSTEYDDKWAESLGLFADYLEAGGTIAHRDLYEQAKVAARTIAWEERHIASRGRDGADVLAATGRKADVKDRLGRSPDHLDAALMAVWRDRSDPGDVDDRATTATISW